MFKNPTTSLMPCATIVSKLWQASQAICQQVAYNRVVRSKSAPIFSLAFFSFSAFPPSLCRMGRGSKTQQVCKGGAKLFIISHKIKFTLASLYNLKGKRNSNKMHCKQYIVFDNHLQEIFIRYTCAFVGKLK